MPTPLIPELAGHQLTVDVALRQPTVIRDRIAKLADSQLLMPHFFRSAGGPIEGGALAYTLLKYSDMFTTGDIEKRAPLTEYPLVQGVDPETKLALVEDYGASAEISDEEISRNNISRMDQITTQITNELTMKLDNRAMKAVADADIDEIAVANSWDDLVVVGAADDITPSAGRPTAHFAQAQELADLDQLGVVFDELLVHPTQARALRTAYVENLGKMLESAGLKMHVNARIPAGTAYLVQSSQPGIVGFEIPLTVRVIERPEKRGKLIQAFAVSIPVIDRPHAVKKLVGLGS